MIQDLSVARWISIEIRAGFELFFLPYLLPPRQTTTSKIYSNEWRTVAARKRIEWLSITQTGEEHR